MWALGRLDEIGESGEKEAERSEVMLSRQEENEVEVDL